MCKHVCACTVGIYVPKAHRIETKMLTLVTAEWWECNFNFSLYVFSCFLGYFPPQVCITLITSKKVIFILHLRPQRLTIATAIVTNFPCGSDSKASAYNSGDPGSIPGLGRSPGEGNGNPLQYSCLENPMDGGTW